MNLWKKLLNVTINGIKNRIPKGSVLTAEAGSTVDIAGTFKVGGTAVTADAGELNILDGVLATAAEINRTVDPTGRIVTSTATVLALTVTQHGDRVVLINTNSTVANTFTLPLATGSGVKMTLINNIAQTQGSVVIAANGTTNVLNGKAYIVSSTEEAAICAFTTASSDKITMNRTTTGGLGGDMVEAWDSSTGVWTVNVTLNGNGAVATPFSES